MKTLTKNILLTALIFAWFCPAAYSEQTEPLQSEIQFEVSQTDIWQDSSSYKIEPTHIAVIFTKDQSIDLNRPKRGTRRSGGEKKEERQEGQPPEIRDVLKYVGSEQQRKFMHYHWNTYLSNNEKFPAFLSYPYSPDATLRPIFIRGTSLEDTKLLVQSLIECVNDRSAFFLEQESNKLEKYNKKKSELEKEIAENEKEEKQLTTKLDREKLALHYQNADEARAAISDFAKTLRLTQIEIADSQAMLDMIERQKEGCTLQKVGSIYQSMQNLLFEMRLKEEIKRAGAQARRQTLEGILLNASNFASSTDTREKLRQTLKNDQKELSRLRERIADLEETLANPPAHMRPLEIADNKVLIYPIESKKEEPAKENQ